MNLDASATRCQRESLHLDARCSSVQPSVHQRRVKVSEATRPTTKTVQNSSKDKLCMSAIERTFQAHLVSSSGEYTYGLLFRDVPAMC